MVERVGFIGLGDMGEPMARNLCGGSFEVVVYDLRSEVVSEVANAGAHGASSCREVGERSEVVGLCVIDDAATEAVAGEVLEGAAPGSVLAIHGTVSPAAVQRIAAKAAAQECEVVDAQVTGGRGRASQRQLRYMVGGSDAAVERCRPVFATSAEEITHCGPLGMGSIAKLCNNLVQFQAWQGYVEASLLAEKSGLSREKLFEVLSWILNYNARAFLMARSVIKEQPANEALVERFEGVMQLAEKDLRLALDLASDVGVSMPFTDLSVDQLRRLFGFESAEDA
ncbi:MAG: NAD(P)-dependent oxidoreductase [Myxococcota bacterium]|nr:NAD(P)-dependent oxidoreductase [Myxococcota bacterium]